MGLTEIFRLYQARIGSYLANSSHRKNDTTTLLEECAGESQIIVTVRVPVTIKSGESRCSQRLIYRSKLLNPGIPPG